MMTYQETVEYILNIPLFAKKIGTENLTALMKRLGNPQDVPKVIHVAGTNGKGSVCKALAALLEQSGKKVGLFTSPHLLSPNERIRVNGELISDSDFVRSFEKVRSRFEEHPSFFEVLFAMAAVYFEEKKVDYAIYETGMGGRLDATNIVRPVVTVITSIGLDHMQYLGDTIEAIAGEKAGIIKPGIPVLYFRRDAVSARIIETRAESLGSPVIAVEKSQYIINVLEDKTIDFSFHNRYYSYDHLKMKKTALYQVENACLAILAFVVATKQERQVTGYIPAEQKNGGEILPDKLQAVISEGLMSFAWEGRMEEVAPGIYVDGAHNPEAIEAYCKTLNAFHKGCKKILVFAAVKDKDYEAMIMKLLYHLKFEQIIVTAVDSDRKAPVEQIAGIFRSYTDTEVKACRNIEDAMAFAVRYRSMQDNANIYCVGSLYLVAGVKRWLS